MDSPPAVPHPVIEEVPPPSVDLAALPQEQPNLFFAQQSAQTRMCPHLWTSQVPLTPEELKHERDPTLIKVARPSYDFDDIAVLLLRAYEMGRSGRPFTLLDWE